MADAELRDLASEETSPTGTDLLGVQNPISGDLEKMEIDTLEALISPPASATVAGIAELATTAEINTGTDTGRVITPAGLTASALQIKVDGITAGADITNETTVTDALDGATLTDIGTPAVTDTVLIQDADDSSILKGAAFSEFLQTGAEIKALYEAVADTNAYTDADAAVVAATSGTNTGDEVAATDTTAGVAELATIAEVDTGTDTGRVITPAGLAGSALQTKVDGIETGATADQTGAQIKTLYEAEADTNAYDDAAVTKLGAIEALADVTGATNVAAAGAPIITSGAGAPSSTPAAVGNIYVDTTGDIVWTAAGTASSADWKQATGAGGGDLLASQNLADLDNASTARTNLGVAIGSDVQAHSATLDAVSGTNTGDEVAATTTTAGVIELATTAEVNTGTATDRAITPDALTNATMSGDLSGSWPNPTVDDDSHNHTSSSISGLDTADVVSGTFADARISASSVQQHVNQDGPLELITHDTAVDLVLDMAVNPRGYRVTASENITDITFLNVPTTNDLNRRTLVIDATATITIAYGTVDFPDGDIIGAMNATDSQIIDVILVG